MMLSRVCIVSETYLPEINGVANTLGCWVRGLIDRGISVQVVRPRQHEDDHGMVTRHELHQVVPSLPLPGYPGLRFGLPAGKQLAQLWRQEIPDAVYIATQGPLGLSALRMARRMNIPAFSGFHTNFHLYSNFYHLGWLERLVFGYLRRFHNNAAATMVPTRRQSEWLSERGFRNVTVLRRGVDQQRFHPDKRSQDLRRAWGAASDTPVVLYVGRLAAEKNVGLVARAFEQLRSRHPDLCFVMVGDGPQRKALQARCPDIHFTGVQTGAALSAHYASADIFLFPSHTDTFGNVVTEAMASQLAIVSFREAAARELLRHERSALLVEPGQDDEFIDQIERLLVDPALRARLRERAWHAAQSLHWSSIVTQLIRCLSGQEAPVSVEESYGRVQN